MTKLQDKPDVPPLAERLMPAVDTVPLNEALVLSNSCGVPPPM